MPPRTKAEPRDPWLMAFHAGERSCMEACYRDYFETVERAVGTILHGADRETVVHEIFFRLLTEEVLRQRFGGGSLAAWLRVIARNQAIDHARRRRREISLGSLSDPPGESTDDVAL